MIIISVNDRKKIWQFTDCMASAEKFVRRYSGFSDRVLFDE